MSKYSYRIFQISTSLIFIIAGVKHVFSPEDQVQRLLKAPGWDLLKSFFNPDFLIIASGGVMTLAGIALALNYKARWSSLILITMLVPITLVVQVGSMTTLGPLFKNIAILGSLFFIAFGQKNILEVEHA